jgi:cytidylate kinase
MPAITISREIGSLGDLIAEQIAKRLGYKLVDKNTIGKIFYQFGFLDFKEVYEETGFWSQFDLHRTEMVSFLNRIIETAAFHGNIVLLGRGGFAMLKSYSDVLNVRIKAPFSLRVERVMEERAFASLAEAEEFVQESDRMRKDFVNSMYAERWDSITAFDMVIDTCKITAPQAVDWLQTAAGTLQHVQPDKVLTTRAKEIDPVLLDSLVQVLDKQPA